MTTHLNNILYVLYLMVFCFFFLFFCNILFSFCQYAPYYDMICLSYVVFDSLILLYLFIYIIIIIYLCSYIFIYFNFLGWGLCSECSCLFVCVLFVKKTLINKVLKKRERELFCTLQPIHLFNSLLIIGL